MMMQTTFGEVTPSQLPFMIEFINGRGVVVWSATVSEPGILCIPALTEKHGPVATRISFANGEVAEYPASMHYA